MSDLFGLAGEHAGKHPVQRLQSILRTVLDAFLESECANHGDACFMLLDDTVELCIFLLPAGNRLADAVVVLVGVDIHVLSSIVEVDLQIGIQPFAVAVHVIEGNFDLTRQMSALFAELFIRMQQVLDVEGFFGTIFAFLLLDSEAL